METLSPPANAFVAQMRKLYHPVGFRKGYNFILWFIFCGALMGFSLARFQYLSYNGIFCSPGPGGPDHAAPGECWAYSTKDVYKVGIRMHLYTIIPASFLACFQFVPVIRRRLLLLHRLNGYIVVTLSLLGTVGALMIARVSFGGTLGVQVLVGVLAIMFLASMGLALYNIKMLQIEQHRAWMLRAWFYAGCIVTSRIIFIIASTIISQPFWSPYYAPWSCAKLAPFYDNATALQEAYPACTSPDQWSAVVANSNMNAENVGAAFEISFAMTLWLALTMHAIGVEVYLHLTPAEAERLRNISYQKQLEAGFKNPGRAGLTVDRLGDSEMWVPSVVSKETPISSTESVPHQ